MLRILLKWIALLYLIVESLGLVAACLKLGLKLTQSNGSLSYGPVGDLSLNVAVHLAITGAILSAYLLLRKLSRLPLVVTRESALLAARAAQSGCLAVIGICALASERMTAVARPSVLFSAWAISSSAVGTVIVASFLRRRFLSQANDWLRTDHAGVEAIRQWRMWTILSMGLALSVAMYGFTLRMQGYVRAVEWFFFACAVVLLFLWRPRLSEGPSALENPV